MSDKVSRRQFAKIARLSAAGIASPLGTAETAKPASAPRAATRLSGGLCLGHGDLVLSGRGGAVNEDGRGASIWDKFVRIPGKIEDGTTGDRANEHYHRYKEDIALIKATSAARPIASRWPGRGCFPDGDGKPNPKGSTSTIA